MGQTADKHIYKPVPVQFQTRISAKKEAKLRDVRIVWGAAFGEKEGLNMRSWERAFPGRGNSNCKGPEVGRSLIFLKKQKVVGIAET